MERYLCRNSRQMTATRNARVIACQRDPPSAFCGGGEKHGATAARRFAGKEFMTSCIIIMGSMLENHYNAVSFGEVLRMSQTEKSCTVKGVQHSTVELSRAYRLKYGAYIGTNGRHCIGKQYPRGQYESVWNTARYLARPYRNVR